MRCQLWQSKWFGVAQNVVPPVECKSLIPDIVVETDRCEYVDINASDFPLFGRPEAHFSHIFSPCDWILTRVLAGLAWLPFWISFLSSSSPAGLPNIWEVRWPVIASKFLLQLCEPCTYFFQCWHEHFSHRQQLSTYWKQKCSKIDEAKLEVKKSKWSLWWSSCVKGWEEIHLHWADIGVSKRHQHICFNLPNKWVGGFPQTRVGVWTLNYSVTHDGWWQFQPTLVLPVEFHTLFLSDVCFICCTNDLHIIRSFPKSPQIFFKNISHMKVNQEKKKSRPEAASNFPIAF